MYTFCLSMTHLHTHIQIQTLSLSLSQWHQNCFTARLLSLIKQLLTIRMEGFMSLADFSTVKANSTASGELCLALQEMRTGEDTKGEEEVERRGVISQQSIWMSVVSPLMCWLRVGPLKRVKIESWALGSADKISETDLIWGRFFFLSPRNTCGFVAQRCFIASCYHKENWKNRSVHLTQVPAQR